MLDPYIGEKDYRGYPIYQDDELYNLIKIALKEGQQIQAHCNGDAASEQFISQIEKYSKEFKTNDNRRSVIIHSQLMNHKQIYRASKLDLIASFFINHL